jgi:PAS domain S-box-containing protein
VASSRPSDRLRASVGLVLLAMFAIVAAARAVDLWWRHNEILASAERHAEGLALIVDEHMRRSLAAIDAVLAQLALHATRIGGAMGDSDDWMPVLEASRAALPGVSALTVVDASGVVQHSTAPVIGQSRRDTFVFQRLAAEPAAGVVADTPFRGQITGRIGIPLGRRLGGDAFGGIVVATFLPDELRGFHRAIDVGPHGAVWIFHASGVLLIREPAAGTAIGESAGANPIFAAAQRGAAAGRLRATLDGAMQIAAYRTLGDAQMVVATSLAVDDVLADWRREVAVSLALAAIIAALFAAAGVMLFRQIRARAAATARLRESTQALQVSESRFQAVMDHAPLLVSLKDLAGNYAFVNEAFARYVGRRAEDMIGRKVEEFLPQEESTAIAALDQDVAVTRQPFQREIETHRPEGARTMLMVKFPVLDRDGGVIAVGTVMADVTEQRQAEVQLARAQRMEAVGQLTGGIAHDFNNLLTVVLGNTDVMIAQLSDPELRRIAEVTLAAAERGAELTKGLLAFGRRQPLSPRRLDINAQITQMQPLLARTLGEHVEIQLIRGANLWPALADPGQLETAVLNLAINARDAMPHGGTLTIQTETAHLDEVYARANPDVTPGDYVMVAVGDTGSGMAPEVAARAFEPFFTTKDVGKGTGLGLSQVYGFVKQSGGHVKIYSELGLGTMVKVYLPRARVQEAAAAEAAPAAEPPRGTESILLVEDDAAVRDNIATQLTALGYRVTTAENGAAALASLAEHAPDLLVTDVVMPGGMNGRQLAEAAHARHGRLRVLYISGYTQDALAPLGQIPRGTHLLTKPFRRGDLARAVRSVLDDARVTPSA